MAGSLGEVPDLGGGGATTLEKNEQWLTGWAQQNPNGTPMTLPDGRVAHSDANGTLSITKPATARSGSATGVTILPDGTIVPNDPESLKAYTNGLVAKNQLTQAQADQANADLKNGKSAADVGKALAEAAASNAQAGKTNAEVAAGLPASQAAANNAQAEEARLKTKQATQGALVTQLQQIEAAAKSGQISVSDAEQASAQAVMEANKNYIDATTRASTLTSYNAAQVTEADNTSKNAINLLNNTMDIGTKYNYSNVAGKVMGNILQNAGSIIKQPNIKSPLETMGVDPMTGLTLPFTQKMQLMQPVSDQHANDIRNLIGTTNPKTGWPYSISEAAIKVAQDNGILPADFGTQPPASTTPPAASPPLSDAGTGASSSRT